MSQKSLRQKGDPTRDSEEKRRARLKVKQEMTRVVEQRRIDTRSEYDLEGEERRARSAELRALRKLKAAVDEIAEKSS